MSEWRMVFLIAALKARQELQKPAVWSGLLLGAGYSAFYAMRYTEFAAVFPVQITEAFILLMNGWPDLTFLLLGYLFVTADLPCVDALHVSILSRSGKKAWVCGMLLYMAGCTLLYVGLVWLAGAAVCALHGLSEGNGWSETMRLLARAQPERAASVYHLSSPPAGLLTEISPLAAGISEALLLYGYGLLMALVMFTANLNARFPRGSFFAALIHLLGLLLIRDGQYGLARFVPMGNVLTAMHAGAGMRSVFYSMGYFLVLILILSVLAHRAAYRCDYRMGESK